MNSIHRISHLIKLYHNYQIEGLDKIPTSGRTIFLLNHTFATYEILPFSSTIYDATGRKVKTLTDSNFWKIPLGASFMESFGGVEGTPQNGKEVLDNEEMLIIEPGGMKEAIKGNEKKYQIFWEERKGFARLALNSRSPIILAACPAGDDIFDVHRLPFTDWAYNQFKIPLVFVRGIGPSLIPRPIKLTHFLSDPIYPPNIEEEDFDKVENEILPSFHQEIIEKMNSFMRKVG